MRTSSRSIVLLALTVVATGCVTTRTAQDLDAIRRVTDAVALPAVEHDEVEREVRNDVRELLRDELSAEKAASIAILGNRELRATLRELGIARGHYVQAGLLPNPGFEFDLREPGARGEPLQVELFVEWNLTRAILTAARARVARALLEAARYRAAAAVVETGYRARAAFFAHQIARARLATAMRSLEAFAASRDAARALYDAGNVAMLDVVTQDAAYESARVVVAELELEVLSTREALQRVLGLHGEDAGWTASEAVPGLPEAVAPEAAGTSEDVEREVIRTSFALGEARSRLEALARETGIARTEGWLPEITVDAHTERDGARWEIGGGAHISVPIFDQRQGTRAALESEFDAQLERYLGLAVDLRSEARELTGRLRSTEARARQMGEVVLPARQRVFEQTLLQYNAMQLGTFQLLEAQRAVLDAELRRLEVLRELWTTRAALDALVAGHRVGRMPTTGATAFGAASDSTGGH